MHFENHANISDPGFLHEVGTWLNSSECKDVFNAMEGKISELAIDIRKKEALEKKTSDSKQIDPVYVYVASDNEIVKQTFAAKILANPTLAPLINIMRVESKHIYHVKNINRLKKETKNEGLMDLVFDWYSLSLANHVLAWRKGSTNMVSTFVHSAQRVSGTTERTNFNENGKGGMGTRGFQLTRHRRGYMKFDQFWSYTFLEDYQ